MADIKFRAIVSASVYSRWSEVETWVSCENSLRSLPLHAYVYQLCVLPRRGRKKVSVPLAGMCHHVAYIRVPEEENLMCLAMARTTHRLESKTQTKSNNAGAAKKVAEIDSKYSKLNDADKNLHLLAPQRKRLLFCIITSEGGFLFLIKNLSRL